MYPKNKIDFLIVGSGFYGCVLAERIASDLKKDVLIVKLSEGKEESMSSAKTQDTNQDKDMHERYNKEDSDFYRGNAQW